MREIESVAKVIVDTGFHIARDLGPGLQESVYEIVFARELARRTLTVERQKYISFDYHGLWFENAFRIDIVVNGIIAIELKSARELRPADYKQLLTYLHLADLKLGFLFNYGETPLKIKRMVYGL